MNDLTVMSDNELDVQLALLEERKEQFQSESGIKMVQSKMLEILGTVEQYGYELKNADRKKIAKIWAHGLKDEIIRLGYTGIREAVVMWIECDVSQFMRFPKVREIADICKEMHGDPRVEKGKRDYQKRIALMEQEHREQLEAWKSENPEDWERVKQRAEVMMNERNRQDENIQA